MQIDFIFERQNEIDFIFAFVIPLKSILCLCGPLIDLPVNIYGENRSTLNTNTEATCTHTMAKGNRDQITRMHEACNFGKIETSPLLYSFCFRIAQNHICIHRN